MEAVVSRRAAVLDGSHSFQPGNATLITWGWTVFLDTTYNGEQAVVTFNAAFTHHIITLTVTNSDGLVGTETFVFPRIPTHAGTPA